MKKRNVVVQNMITRSALAGGHANRERDLRKGSSRKIKHKKKLV